MALHVDTIPTPLRDATVATDDDGALVRFTFTESVADVLSWARAHGELARCSRGRADRIADQVGAWFDQRCTTFDLPLAPRGTAFQQTVWAALRSIPFGEVRTYGAVAQTIGRPTASRAIGQANGRNPIALIIPCHRVVSAQGLGGYTGGLDIKRALLEHEGTLQPSWFP